MRRSKGEPNDRTHSFVQALPDNMNTDRTYQVFVQCVFKSIIDYLETSELCASSAGDDQTTALNFGLGESNGSVQAPQRSTYVRTFSNAASSGTMSMSAYKLLLENVTHYIERMVDKIWDIDYREPKQIFEFVIKIINQAKKRSSTSFLDSLYRSLNRTILFELSRKIDSIGGTVIDSMD